MPTVDNKTNTENPVSQLNHLIKKSFTGSLLVKNNDNLNWKLYFRLGRLIWSTGTENYINKQWQRHIESFFSDSTNEKKTMLLQQKSCQYYNFLAHLYAEKNVAQNKKITDLITSILVEVVFDLIQYDANNPEELSYTTVANDKPETLITLIKTDLVCQQATNDWEKWVAAGFKNMSPNLFPAIEQVEIFQEKIASNLDSQFICLIDGKTSLRNLAVKTRLDLITLTKYIVPSFQVGAISLHSVPNLQKNELKLSIYNYSGSQQKPQQDNEPLIFCVDDSQIICQDLEKVIVGNYYRFMCTQEPFKAMPLLIGNSPDLIFLDVIMPVVNGYELCAQLRRSAKFKDVPIVILTGKDGLVDRMRAKLAGATEFISKPVNEEEVMTLLHKFLHVK